jgi:two-component system response regulator AtoC
MARILLVEDDEIMRITLYDRLCGLGFTVDQEDNGMDALRMIKDNTYHLIISDIKMPGLDGIKLLHETRMLVPGTDTILMTAYGSVEDAAQCLKNGATDYIIKPFDMDDLTIRVNRILANQKIRAKCLSLEEGSRPTRIIGSSKVITEMQSLLSRIATADSTVLITGESGTGKELAAAAIHYQSNHAKGPYIKVNCGAIPENLIESELFGHEKGAFTGASSRKPGRFEMADEGSLLLDEIGDLPLQMQVKLLRVLQEKEVERLGGTRPIKVNVRVICATAKDLLKEVKAGTFREDLFYRLQVIPVKIPPLRERKEDIPELCDHFLEEFSLMRGMPLSLSPDAMNCLLNYDFPGNIRELRNIIERASVLTQTSLIDILELPCDLTGNVPKLSDTTSCNLAESVAMAEKNCILQALRQSMGNKTAAAILLGISRKNLWEKMNLYKIKPS